MFIGGLKKLPKRRIARNESGFTLVEVVISIMLLGIVTAAVFTGLGTASKALLQNDSRQTAKNLAETQMESVKNQTYVLGASSYPKETTSLAQQSGYDATISVINGWLIPNPDTRDSSIQKIVVTITRSGVVIYTLEGYKVK